MSSYFYSILSFPLSAPSFFLLYKILVSPALRESVFNQQLAFIFGLNGLIIPLTSSITVALLAGLEPSQTVCFSLMMLRACWTSFFIFGLFQAILFRFLMIRYSSRGLVHRGPNLGLFNNLFQVCQLTLSIGIVLNNYVALRNKINYPGKGPLSSHCHLNNLVRRENHLALIMVFPIFLSLASLSLLVSSLLQVRSSKDRFKVRDSSSINKLNMMRMRITIRMIIMMRRMTTRME